MQTTQNVTPEQETVAKPAGTVLYLLIGMVFGVALTKAEAVSWFRMQEMFRFQGFHMYGMIGSAVVTGMLSLFLIKKFGVTDRSGAPITISPKEWGKGIRYWLGGTIFGMGWALTGACPGPILALFGSGVTVVAAVFASALVGTWVYGVLRPYLPH